LRHIAGEGHTVARSSAKVQFHPSDRDDLERYLDVTRGELFFSKAVILVEGDAERFLIPVLAKLYDEEFDLDEMGITVCSISGTNFAPYVKLLGPRGLDIPFVVLTDFDPKGSGASQEDEDPDDPGVTDSYGENRVVNHIMKALLPSKKWEPLSFKEVLDLAPKYGVFMNEFTFEVDLFYADAEEHYLKAVKELSDNKAMLKRFSAFAADPATFDAKQFLKDVDSIGKGRVAQRLGRVLQAAKFDSVPSYIEDAFAYLRSMLALLKP